MNSPQSVLPGWNVVSPLDIPSWDQAVSEFPSADIFHGVSWAKVLLQAYGQRPSYLVWPWKRGFGGVLPFMEVRNVFGVRRGVSLPFSDFCTPLIRCDGNLSLTEMRDAALQHGNHAGWREVELRCVNQDLFPSWSSTYYAHELPLALGPERLFALCKPAVRRAVRRARDEGLRVDFSSGVPAVKEYYKLHCITRKRHGLPPQPWRFFHCLAENLVDGKSGFVARARLGTKTIAAAVFLVAGGRATYKFGASEHHFQVLRANNLVMWEAIAKLAVEGAKTLHFGRTSLSNEGLRRYKLGWGTTENKLYYYRVSTSSGKIIPGEDRSSGWHTRLFGHLPIAALRLIGNVLYRYQS